MKSKPRSTADKLTDYRERLAKHYRALRSDKCKPVPKPQTAEFAPQYRSFVERINEQELAAHQAALERMK